MLCGLLAVTLPAIVTDLPTAPHPLCAFAERFTITMDYDGSFNILPSRGSLTTYDVLPPGRCQVLQVLSVATAEDGSRMACQSQFRADMVSSETHSPDAEAVHQTMPLQRDLPDPRHNLGELFGAFGVKFI